MVWNEGSNGYSPGPSRSNVWGINGDLHEELAQRDTLCTRRIVKAASSATSTEPGSLGQAAGSGRPRATVALNVSRSGDRPLDTNH